MYSLSVKPNIKTEFAGSNSLGICPKKKIKEQVNVTQEKHE